MNARGRAGPGESVWGGDFNHALAGRMQGAGSTVGRHAISQLADFACNHCSHRGSLPHRRPGILSIDHIGVPGAWKVTRCDSNRTARVALRPRHVRRDDAASMTPALPAVATRSQPSARPVSVRVRAGGLIFVPRADAAALLGSWSVRGHAVDDRFPRPDVNPAWLAGRSEPWPRAPQA